MTNTVTTERNYSDTLIERLQNIESIDEFINTAFEQYKEDNNIKALLSSLKRSTEAVEYKIRTLEKTDETTKES